MDAHHAGLITPVAAAVARALETLIVALAAAACLRSAGVVVAIALFSGPVIAAWSLARTLWQVWLIAIGVASLAVVLTYGVSLATAAVLDVEPRISGVLALWLVVLAVLAPVLAVLVPVLAVLVPVFAVLAPFKACWCRVGAGFGPCWCRFSPCWYWCWLCGCWFSPC